MAPFLWSESGSKGHPLRPQHFSNPPNLLATFNPYHILPISPGIQGNCVKPRLSIARQHCETFVFSTCAFNQYFAGIEPLEGFARKEHLGDNPSYIRTPLLCHSSLDQATSRLFTHQAQERRGLPVVPARRRTIVLIFTFQFNRIKYKTARLVDPSS